MNREPIASVLERHTPELMRIPGVIGTGEGRERGEPAIIVFVERRSPALDARLPKELDAYPVFVREAGHVKALDK